MATQTQQDPNSVLQLLGVLPQDDSQQGTGALEQAPAPVFGSAPQAPALGDLAASATKPADTGTLGAVAPAAQTTVGNAVTAEPSPSTRMAVPSLETVPQNAPGQEAFKAKVNAMQSSIDTETDPAQKELLRYELDKYKEEHPWGSPESAHPGIGGKIGHILGKIGETGLTALSPGLAAELPGTDLGRRVEENSLLGKVKGLEDVNLQRQQAEYYRQKPLTEALAPETATYGALVKSGVAPLDAMKQVTDIKSAADAAGKPFNIQDYITSLASGKATPPAGMVNPATQKPYTPQEYIDYMTKLDQSLRVPTGTENQPLGADAIKAHNDQITNELKSNPKTAGVDPTPYLVKQGDTGATAKDRLEAAKSLVGSGVQQTNAEREANAPQEAQDRKDARTMGYAVDADGNLSYMNKADADKLHSTFEEMKPADVKADRQAIRQLNDVQQNVSRYRDAVNAIKSDISSEDASKMAGILSDKELGAKLEPFGVGLDIGQLNDAFTQTQKANYWNALPGPEQDAVLSYLRAKSAVIAYQKALTGIGRTNKESLEIEMAQLPAPYVGSTTGNKQLNAFQENIDRAAEGFPSNLPGLKSPAQIRKETEKGGATSGHSFSVGGKNYSGVSDEDYEKAKKLEGFKE